MLVCIPCSIACRSLGWDLWLWLIYMYCSRWWPNLDSTLWSYGVPNFNIFREILCNMKFHYSTQFLMMVTMSVATFILMCATCIVDYKYILLTPSVEERDSLFDCDYWSRYVHVLLLKARISWTRYCTWMYKFDAWADVAVLPHQAIQICTVSFPFEVEICVRVLFYIKSIAWTVFLCIL